MFRAALGFLGLVPVWLWAALLALALASAAATGYRAGANATQARWDATKLKQREIDAAERERQAATARSAEAEFERWRAEQARRRPEVAHGLRKSLERPALASVVVPADVVRWLRESGADGSAPESAASQPGR